MTLICKVPESAVRSSRAAAQLDNSKMKSGCVLACLLLTHCCRSTLFCPVLCKCHPGKTEVVCHEVPLTAYPTEGLPENITMLTIQFTNITVVSEHQLSATPLLQELHLYGNQLQSLSPHLLRGVPRLHTLDLTGNSLSVLPAHVFHQASLRNLVLKKNLLKHADAEWLPASSGLLWLDLSENHLTSVPAGLLQRSPHLESLDLSNNLLEKISADALDPLTGLERLNLQNNKLHALDESAFRELRNLTSLFLAQNKMAVLPRELFRGLARLRQLNLENNQLEHVPEGLLEPLRSLEEQGLDLTSNPLLCDETVEYLWRWLQMNKEKVLLADSVLCARPPPLTGRSVTSLTENELKKHSHV